MKSRRITSTEEKSLLETFAFLRFPLIACVVLCHAYISGLVSTDALGCFVKTSFVLSKIVARVAVPNFLLISGYLFFRNIESFTLQLYGDKLKRRLRSVVVPYLFWNVVVILLYFIWQSVVPELFSGANTKICDYTPLEWVKAFWRVDGTMSPINPPLWYVRNLLVVFVISPLLYALLKNRGIGAIVIVITFLLWVFVPSIEMSVVWLQPKFIFFFSLGAWYAIHKVAIPKFRPAVVVVGVVLYALAIAGVFVCRGRVDNILYELALLIGSLLVMYCACYLVGTKGWRIPSWISSSYFFIFVYHAIPLSLLMRVTLRLLKPETNGEFFAIYFGSCIVILLLGVGLFHLIKRIFPKITAIILGSRA